MATLRAASVVAGERRGTEVCYLVIDKRAIALVTLLMEGTPAD